MMMMSMLMLMLMKDDDDDDDDGDDDDDDDDYDDPQHPSFLANCWSGRRLVGASHRPLSPHTSMTLKSP